MQSRNKEELRMENNIAESVETDSKREQRAAVHPHNHEGSRPS